MRKRPTMFFTLLIAGVLACADTAGERTGRPGEEETGAETSSAGDVEGVQGAMFGELNASGVRGQLTVRPVGDDVQLGIRLERLAEDADYQVLLYLGECIDHREGVDRTRGVGTLGRLSAERGRGSRRSVVPTSRLAEYDEPLSIVIHPPGIAAAPVACADLPLDPKG